ncbi:MAG: hypothetical protein ACK56I_05385 [bacterium]
MPWPRASWQSSPGGSSIILTPTVDVVTGGSAVSYSSGWASRPSARGWSSYSPTRCC